jgi:hypothetical protein
MKHLSLSELVNQLKSEALKKRDVIVPVKSLNMLGTKINFDTDMSELKKMLLSIGVKSTSQFSLSLMENAHQQVAEKIGIPKSYYDKMLNYYPSLLDVNVNIKKKL